MVTLHDKISDQVDLADRGRAGSDPAGRQSAAPVKSLTKIFTVFIQWADKSGVYAANYRDPERNGNRAFQKIEVICLITIPRGR